MNKDATPGTLPELLAMLASRDAQAFNIGYVSTPRTVAWVRRRGQDLVTAAGTLDLEWAYETRLFGAEGDLRWRWDEDHGQWSVLNDALAAARGWSALKDHAHQRVRLLRGSALAAGTGGWTTLWDGQAAPYDLPIELARGASAALTTIEYVCQDPRHGTVDVVAERFVALQAWKGTEE